MTTPPISGYTSRLTQHFKTLCELSQKCADRKERLDLLRWYIEYGTLMGLELDDLVSQINKHIDFKELVKSVVDGDMDSGKYPPEFRRGEVVKVKVNAKNITPHTGKIIDHIWHFKNAQWNFYIEENGKKVSKRYLASDLKRIDE